MPDPVENLAVEEPTSAEAPAGEGRQQTVDIDEEVIYGDGKPKASPKPKVDEDLEDEPKPKAKNQWDKARQQRDQEIAAERKEMRTAMEALAKQNEKLNATLEALTKKGATTDPSDGEGGEGDEAMLDLDEFSSAADIARAFKALQKTVKAKTDRVAELEGRLNQNSEEAAKRDGRDIYEKFIGTIDSEYGESVRSEAVASANQWFHDHGYSNDNPPNWDAYEARVEAEAAKIVAKDPKRQRTRREPRVAPGSGKGGGQAATLKGGSNKDVFASMRSEGKFDPSRY